MNWHGVADSVESSRKLLESLWAMDADAVAAGVEKAHEEISILNIMMKILLAVPFSSPSILHGNTTLWFGNCRQEKDLPMYA